MTQYDSSNQGAQSEQPHPLVLHTRVISGQGGGPEKTTLNSPRFLGPLGYRGGCVYLRDPVDAGFRIVRERAEQKRAPLVEVDDLGIRDWRVVGRMRQAVQQVVGQAAGQWALGGGWEGSPPLIASPQCSALSVLAIAQPFPQRSFGMADSQRRADYYLKR